MRELPKPEACPDFGVVLGLKVWNYFFCLTLQGAMLVSSIFFCHRPRIANKIKVLIIWFCLPKFW